MQVISEKDLHKQQEILVNTARKALDEGRIIDALSLVERVSDFWPQNLITIMGVFCSRPTDEMKKWAFSLLKKHLEQCSRSINLVGAALWVRNPKRSLWLPDELKQSIDDRRRALEPDWDGVWQDPGLDGARVFALLSKEGCPEKVFDKGICLIVAGQSSDWRSWMSRYLVLGGSAENPKYMKVRIAKAVESWEKPSLELKKMLRRYCEIGNVCEVRAFLRNITPTRKSRKGKNPNKGLAMDTLLAYCSWERLEHEVEDWVHIAKSSLYLKHNMIQRIAQRGLAGLERPPSAHQIFEKLVAINGEIRVTNDAKSDIGPAGNPIWQSVYRLLPINGNARKILLSYSKYEMEAS